MLAPPVPQVLLSRDKVLNLFEELGILINFESLPVPSQQ